MPNRRMLKANNIHQVTAYIDHMYELLLAHNALQRGSRLTYPGNRHQFAQRLDRDVLAAGLLAEAKIPQFDVPAWSLELSRVRQQMQYLRKCLSAFRTHLNHAGILREYTTSFPEDEVPQNQRHCSRLLRSANSDIRTLVKQSFINVEQNDNSESKNWKRQYSLRTKKQLSGCVDSKKSKT